MPRWIVATMVCLAAMPGLLPVRAALCPCVGLMLRDVHQHGDVGANCAAHHHSHAPSQAACVEDAHSPQRHEHSPPDHEPCGDREPCERQDPGERCGELRLASTAGPPAPVPGVQVSPPVALIPIAAPTTALALRATAPARAPDPGPPRAGCVVLRT